MIVMNRPKEHPENKGEPIGEMTIDFLECVCCLAAIETDSKQSEIMVFEVRFNDRYQPDWKPFNKVFPGDSYTPGWLDAFEKFNFEGHATHIVDLWYPNTDFGGTHARIMYGVNVNNGDMTCWQS